MTPVFVDTSALVALLNADDEQHQRAARVFERLRTQRVPLMTTSYVLVETYALVGRRLGLEAVLNFRADFAPLLDVVWVDELLHNAGLDVLAQRGKWQLSLVDAVSFAAMRQSGVDDAFVFDQHFDQEGFTPVA